MGASEALSVNRPSHPRLVLYLTIMELAHIPSGAYVESFKDLCKSDFDAPGNQLMGRRSGCSSRLSASRRLHTAIIIGAMVYYAVAGHNRPPINQSSLWG